MARNVITIRQLGENVCWTIIQQAMGMPDVKMNSDFLQDRVAMLLFARPSLPERLCCTAAVRQMGATTIYEGTDKEEWQAKESQFQTHLLPIFGYYLDCMYIYGIPVTVESVEQADLKFPIINAGGWNAHPAHAMADIACMLRIDKDLSGVTAAWIGGDNGTLYSLIEAMPWFPFKLNISIPDYIDDSGLRKRAEELNAPVKFYAKPEDAVKNVNFIYAGRKASEEADTAWQITPQLMNCAKKGARLLLSASPIRAIPIDKTILDSHSSLLTKQAEYRLAVHKRILHWVFC